MKDNDRESKIIWDENAVRAGLDQWNEAIDEAAEESLAYANRAQAERDPPHIVAQWRAILDGRSFHNARASAAHDCRAAILRLKRPVTK